MKVRLVIDPTLDDEIVVSAPCRSGITDKIEALVQQAEPAERIAAYLDDDLFLLPVSQIQCITVLQSKTYAVDCSGRKYRLKQSLREMEATLPASFIRINKSALANETHLERFSAAFNGAVDAVFCCGYREYVSRRCFAQIRRRFGL